MGGRLGGGWGGGQGVTSHIEGVLIVDAIRPGENRLKYEMQLS